MFHGPKYDEIGEITAIRKGVEGYIYDFKVLLDEGFVTFVNISEENIFVQDAPVIFLDEWAKEHINEINVAFGEDMSKRCLLIYDSPEDVEDELKEFFHSDSKWFKSVLGKWVGVLG